MFTIGGVDWPPVEAWRSSYQIREVWLKAQADGIMEPFQDQIMGFWHTDVLPDQVGVNMTHLVGIDADRRGRPDARHDRGPASGVPPGRGVPQSRARHGKMLPDQHRAEPGAARVTAHPGMVTISADDLMQEGALGRMRSATAASSSTSTTRLVPA